MRIDIDYFDSAGDLFVPLFADGGVVRQADGSIKLWHKPF